MWLKVSRFALTNSTASGSQWPIRMALPITTASYPFTSRTVLTCCTSTVAPVDSSTSAMYAATSAVEPARVAYATKIVFIVFSPFPGIWNELRDSSSFLKQLSLPVQLFLPDEAYSRGLTKPSHLQACSSQHALYAEYGN